MSPKGFVKVIESYSISGRGLLAELRHFENGLRQGTFLRSKNGAEWTIKGRVFYNHIGSQKKFECEAETCEMLHFSSPEKMKASAEKILQKEKENIYVYYLEGNSLKPNAGDVLGIILTELKNDNRLNNYNFRNTFN